jgi:serine/threonine protein kinase/tetratricopeptide (TPR) repeat protein
MHTSGLRDRLQNALGATVRIERELDGGGMAHVFVAHQVQPPLDIVVKVLDPGLAHEVDVGRFRREIKVASLLKHPRIVPVIEACESADLLYYTMPLVRGETLRALFHRVGPLPVDVAIGYTEDMGAAIAYAHAHNVVHRDIKPENVFVDAGHAIVTDFGIARAIDHASDIASVTSRGLTVGTPKYMSPEQAAADKRLDGRSDIYSLACVMYEMLAGEPPFPGTDTRILLARHMHQDPPSIRLARPDVGVHVEAALLKAMQKSPAARFPTVDAFTDALRQGPLTAPPPPVRRRRWPIAIAAALVLTASAGAGLFARSRNNVHAAPDLDPSRIAVTYFDAPTTDTQLVAIARGMTRELIYELEDVPGLHVVSERGVRTLAPDAPVDSVARMLNVGTVIVGTVERLRDSIRIDVRLVDGTTSEDGARVRSAYPASQVLDLRDTIVETVARRLRPEIGRAVRARERRSATRSSLAWELRQRAQELIDAERVMPSAAGGATARLAMLARADSLLALSSNADTLWIEPLEARGWLRVSTSSYEGRTAAAASIDSGIRFANDILRREPGNANALALRGQLRYTRWSDVGSSAALLDSAGADLQAATLANPTSARAWNSLSVVLRMQGDLPGAAEAVRRAIDSDAYLEEAPQSMTRVVFQYLFASENDSARALCREAMQRFPRDAGVAQCELNVIGWSGRGPADLARVWPLVEQVERSGVWGVTGGVTPEARFYAAAVLARSGMKDSARAVVRDTRARLVAAGKPNASLINEANVLLLLGDRSGALDRLERAAREDSMTQDHMARLPWFVPLRGEPRFQALVKR